MKRCPECRRDYYDDSLIYCLDDGTALLEGPSSGNDPATAIFPGRSSQALRESETKVLGGSTAENGAAQLSANVPSKRKWIIAGALGVLLVTAFGVGSYWLYGRGSSRQIESIAVMPFMNESGNPELEYLSDGITESLIGSLSQLPNLSVKARSSIFRYKNRVVDPRTVGQELNVQAILSGRVVQRGSDVALYLELVDAGSENVLFKADYDRPLANLVALQNEIARDVSNRLRAKLTTSQRAQVEKSGTQNAEAYQLYLKGRFHWNKRKPDEHRKAIQYFEEAIALDPNYALAYSGIADCYAVDTSPVHGQEAIDKLRAAARRAMELDPTLGAPHAAYATTYGPSYDWPASEKEYTRAIELDPNYPTAHQWYAEMLSRLGRHDQAIAEIDRARELDPLSLVINSDRAYILVNARRYDEAIQQAKRTLEMDARWRSARTWLAYAYELKGMFDEALTEYEKSIQYADIPAERKEKALKEVAEGRDVLRRSGPTGYWRKSLELAKAPQLDGSEPSSFYVGALYAILGEKDEAFKWISKAIDEKAYGVDLLKVDPSFDNLRSDPRWPAILARVNLTP